MKTKNLKTDTIISYMTLRRLIGILGMALPFIVVIGGFINNCDCGVQDSVSLYYYTNMKDFFIGLMFAVGLFLTTYKGHDNDHIFMILSGVFALGIAVFPTSMDPTSYEKVGIFGICDYYSMWIHLSFASLYFLTLAYISFFLFTKTDQKKLKRRKRTRNRIYRICGIIMAASMLLIFIYFLFLQETWISCYKPVLILEAVALIAFGYSWLIKGETFFKDKK
ncbi:MAG: DUF998 domain-containing protein [bacterium]